MKKNIIIISIILFIIGILLIVGGLVYNSRPNPTKEESKYKITVDDNVLANCLNDCSDKSNIYYYKFKMDNAPVDYSEALNNINQKTEKLYETNKNTNLDSLECTNYKDKYKYRYIHNINYYWGENNDYITLSYQIETTDICLNTSVKEEPEVLILDKKDNKLLSQKSFIKKEKITKEDIDKTINSGILLNNYYLDDNSNQKQDYNYTKKDNKLYYKFFYLEDELYSYYYQSNTDTYYQTKAIIEDN